MCRPVTPVVTNVEQNIKDKNKIINGTDQHGFGCNLGKGATAPKRAGARTQWYGRRESRVVIALALHS